MRTTFTNENVFIKNIENVFGSLSLSKIMRLNFFNFPSYFFNHIRLPVKIHLACWQLKNKNDNYICKIQKIYSYLIKEFMRIFNENQTFKKCTANSAWKPSPICTSAWSGLFRRSLILTMFP